MLVWLMRAHNNQHQFIYQLIFGHEHDTTAIARKEGGGARVGMAYVLLCISVYLCVCACMRVCLCVCAVCVCVCLFVFVRVAR